MLGYWNNPGETARTLRNGWLHTGDLASMDEDGYFRLKERKKDLIKVRGYSVFPIDVEALLRRHPAVSDCLVVGGPDARDGEVPVAFVIKQSGCRVSRKELYEYCRQSLSPFQVPAPINFVEELPTSHAGKPLRHILREKLWGHWMERQ